jgi:hypothetical protein
MGGTAPSLLKRAVAHEELIESFLPAGGVRRPARDRGRRM